MAKLNLKDCVYYSITMTTPMDISSLNQLMQYLDISIFDDDDQTDTVMTATSYCLECRQINKTDIQWCVECGTYNPYFDGDIDHVLNTYSAGCRIANMLNELNLSSDDQVRCKAIYDNIETFYGQCSDRHNLPNINYILYKIFEIAGITGLYNDIKLPSDSTVITLDKTFKSCCKYYNWKYIPTVKDAHKLFPVFINGKITHMAIN